MIKRVAPIIFILVLMFSANLLSQSRTENRMNFHDAESWILFEDYREALPLYQELLALYPENNNLKYRIGQCYLNMPGEKDKAIFFLEEAVKNINPDYRENRFRETGAPFDALYYLANAYRINNQLDKAIETYQLFREKLDPKIYDTNIVAFQIRSCQNAKVLMASPLFIKSVNLGSTINDNNSEYNAVVSDDETMMVFAKSLPFYDAILFSTKVNGVWSEPNNMNDILKIDRNIYPASLSGDGKTLYLYNSDNYDGNIFKTTFNNGTWSPVVKLNDNINTKYWESHAVVSHDNRKIYFTSNRKGTFGGLDIYVSSRDSTGDWGPARNLGPVINTPLNEETPFLSRDDRTLFFSSRGHLNMGGHDIFYSTLLDNGEWSVPLNAGYPLNSTDDDLFFMPLNQGYEGYFSKFSPDGFGKQDIYRLEIFSDNHPRKFPVKGIARIADINLKTNDKIRIIAVNNRNPGQTSEGYADPETGEYELLVNHGDHTVLYEINGIERYRRDIHLPLLSKSDSFILPPALLPLTDFEATLVVDSEKLIISTEKVIHRPLIVRPEHPALVAEKRAAAISELEKAADDESKSKEIHATEDQMLTSAKDEDARKSCRFWYLWFIAGAVIISLLIIFKRKREKDKE
ncbi:MAG TPA: hypothetical protein DDW27_08175 [Bacteroidales bacterium]|nr:hypothetical protein [Bacteroidales bacterium]